MASFNVSFYLTPPTHNETLKSLILMCKQRLQIYRIILMLKQEKKKFTKENFLLESPALVHFFSNEEKARNTDQVSYFTLFLAYCDTLEMFQLFKYFEKIWFEVRYKSMTIEHQQEFRKLHNFNPSKLTHQELEALKSNKRIEKVEFKVPWIECLHLISKHKGILDAGWLYISEKQLVYWLSQKFSTNLQQQYEKIKERISTSCDERLEAIFSELNLVKTNHPTYSSTPITLESLDTQVGQFPLCMKLHHEKLRREHHLFYRERLQYTRFLKTIGLDLEEALELFRDEFTKIMTEGAFNSEHVYKLKHVYGVVGSHLVYTSYTCERILDIEEANVIGCPFKKLSRYDLKRVLERDGMSDEKIDRILEMRNEKKYQLACTACLKFSSGLRFGEVSEGELIVDPVQYYEQCCNVNVDIEDIYCGSSSSDSQ